VAAFVAIHVHGWQSGSDRGWFAFQQHYAVGVVEQGRGGGVNPWLEYATIVQRDFPGASSLGDAWRVNRTAVFRHVLHNLTAAPSEVGKLFVLPFPDARANIMGAALLALAGVAAFCCAPRVVSTRAWLREHRAGLVIAGCGVVAVVPGLAVQAKTAYLLAIVPLGWLAVAVVATALRVRFTPALDTDARFGAVVAVIVVTAGVTLTAQRSLTVVQPQPVRENVASIRRAWPTPGRLLGLSAESYAAYLGERYTGIEPLASASGALSDPASETFPRLLATQHPDAILVTPQWRSLRSFDHSGEKGLASQGWKKIPLPEGDLYLRAVR
jgi:hypothetical protein